MSPQRQYRGATLSLASIAMLLPFVILLFCSTSSALQADPQAQVSKLRSLAESQHEIVMLLIKKKEFEQALSEADKIFEMKWPPDQEPTLLKSLLSLSDQFHRSGQPAMGIRLLDTNLKVFKTNASQASIWKRKGYFLESMGQHDQALECFRQAMRLEK